MTFTLKLDRREFQIKIILCEKFNKTEDYQNNINTNIKMLHISLNPEYV